MFCLRLRAATRGGEDRTAVTLKWEREQDRGFWPTVVAVLTAPATATAAAGNGPPGTAAADRPPYTLEHRNEPP
jgi:hypothetical protein